MATYPEIYAGQRITSGLLRSMLSDEIAKPIDETINNSTVFHDDSDLHVPLDANAKYRVEFDLSAVSPASALFRTDWVVPLGASGLKYCVGPVGSDRDASLGRFSVHSFSTDVSYGCESSTLGSAIRETGVITTTNAGTLQLRWAQVTAVAGDTGLSAGSRLVVRRIG